MNSELAQAELNSRFDDSLEGRLDGLLREMMVNAQESPGHRSKGDELQDRSQSSVPQSPNGRSVPSTTVFDRSQFGPRHPGGSRKDAEPVPPGGLSDHCPRRSVSCTPESTSEGSTEVIREFEEYSARRRMHVRASENFLG